MVINSDLNILGGLHDFSLVNTLLKIDSGINLNFNNSNVYTSLKTRRSVDRFRRAILDTLIKFDNSNIEFLIRDVIANEDITQDSLLLLFWNASFNNELLHYLNANVYFPAFYSGRISLRQNELVACLKDLRERELQLQKWATNTLEMVGSKYLTLLKKFNLLEGGLIKTITHPYLSDKMFILFIYWLKAIESKSNLLESNWLVYSFSEKAIFIERLMQKKFANYFHLDFTGDKLKIDTLLPYSTIYHAIK